MLELRRGALMQGRAEDQQVGRDRLQLRSGRGLGVIGAKVRAARGDQRSGPEENANQQFGSAGDHCTSLGQCDQRVKRRIEPWKSSSVKPASFKIRRNKPLGKSPRWTGTTKVDRLACSRITWEPVWRA